MIEPTVAVSAERRQPCSFLGQQHCLSVMKLHGSDSLQCYTPSDCEHAIVC